jgi:hypothetical protein
MTQTSDKALAPDQVVTIAGTVGFFKVKEIPDHGRFVVLYGGNVQRRGGIKASSRTVPPAKVEPITSSATLKRANATLHAIAEAMEAAPHPHYKKAGAK